MSEMNEYTPELFELIDDEGNKKNFELIDAAEINGEQYYCMVPAVEDEDFLNSDCDIVILKTIDDDGEEFIEQGIQKRLNPTKKQWDALKKLKELIIQVKI